MQTYIIEGNIGSGKSTLINILEQNNNFEVIQEPVQLWQSIKSADGNLLSEFYKNPERYAYTFQTMAFKTRLQTLEHEQTKPFRFSERSIWSDHYIFGRSCIETNKFSELEVNCYKQWFYWLEDKFYNSNKPNGIIYLQCSPEKCYERMTKRNRSEEENIPLEYLKQIHNYHEEWLTSWNETRVLTINNDTDNNWDYIMTQINEFINKIE